jgi:ribosomal protein L16 Arg81 hydroxylase
MTVENFDFAKLIHPIEPATFFSEYWEQRPLIVSRKAPNYYSDLFSIKALDSVLFFSRPKPPEIKVVANQQELLPDRYIKPDGSLNLNQLYKVYYEGHTLIVNGLQQFWKPLAIFCCNLQNFLNHAVVANTYLSPKDSKGLMPHFDTHDVFVLQVEGAKRWYIHEAFQPVPLLGSFQPVIPEEKLGKPLHEVYLEAGDLLYVPRGFIHHAATAESSSLHLTIGIYPVQWFDLIVNALTAVSMRNECFRKALPAGFLDRHEVMAYLKDQLQEMIQLLSKEVHVEEAVELLAEHFIRQITPVPDGHFTQVDDVDYIDLDTSVAKRTGMRCRIIRQGSSVSIQFPGNTVKGQSHIEQALRFIADTGGTFTIRSIPDTLTDDGKVVLVRRLVRGGLLRVV